MAVFFGCRTTNYPERGDNKQTGISDMIVLARNSGNHLLGKNGMVPSHSAGGEPGWTTMSRTEIDRFI